MDEIALLRALPSGAESPEAARAAALQALEAGFERASAVPSPAPVRTRRRGFFALAGAGAIAAIAAGILAVSSGPSAEPAVAQVLRHTAAVAAAAGAPTPVPRPGQFLYKRTKSLELQEWVPGSYTASFGGVVTKEAHPAPFDAFISWQSEEWMSRNEPSRNRMVMGPPRFLSSAGRSRWEKAGSPLPGLFDGEKVGEPGVDVIEVRRGVRDVETMSGHGFRDFSMLPREAKALRLAIEHRQDGRPIDIGQAIAELWDILDKPNGTPALRAAVFGALAEEPGIELDRDASDLIGRSGYALSYEKPKSSNSEYGQPGIRVEYIFDPETSEILGRREVIADPELVLGDEGVPAGTVRREVAYLQSGIVDSTQERP